MTSVPSATTWGSPTAAKHALLIHGLTASSHTWHRVASSLAAQGYFVTAPNLVGHGSRVATDYRLSSITEDLRPYLEARNYSLIIGHSLGALVALALSAYLPPEYPTAIIVIDPPLHIAPERLFFHDSVISESCTDIKHADAYSIENPLWEREDCIFREFGPRLCPVETVHGVFKQNRPWHFLDYLNETSKKWKVTALVADPAIMPGAGHCIYCDSLDVVVEEALRTVAELEIASS